MLNDFLITMSEKQITYQRKNQVILTLKNKKSIQKTEKKSVLTFC